jgi:uncharacterized membrane protein YhaH (DUF805 family)
MNWYIGVLKKYADFEGRARRKEYWMFILFNILILVALSFVTGSPRSGLVGLYDLIIFLPSLAVGVRRMHDTNHRGWWLLLPIVNLIFALMAGTPGDNRFGPDPKAAAA